VSSTANFLSGIICNVLHDGSLPGGNFTIYVVYNMQLIVEMCYMMTIPIAKTTMSVIVSE
jgi:hypothetical protein